MAKWWRSAHSVVALIFWEPNNLFRETSASAISFSLSLRLRLPPLRGDDVPNIYTRIPDSTLQERVGLIPLNKSPDGPQSLDSIDPLRILLPPPHPRHKESLEHRKHISGPELQSKWESWMKIFLAGSGAGGKHQKWTRGLRNPYLCLSFTLANFYSVESWL